METTSWVRQAGTTPCVLMRPLVGFKPDKIVECRGHPPGPRRIGAERERHQSRRDHHRRAGARSAGNIIGVERARRNAIGRARAVQSGRELIEIGLTDQNGTRGFQQVHDRGGPLRRVGKRRTGACGGQSGDVDIVLDRKRNAIERTPWRMACALDRRCLLDERDPVRARRPAPRCAHRPRGRSSSGLVSPAA